MNYSVLTSPEKPNFNEDVVEAVTNACWILDGATPVHKHIAIADYASCAQWLVQRFSSILKELVEQNQHASFQQLLRQAQENLAHQDKKEIEQLLKEDMPSFTMAAAYISSKEIDFYVLGDCEIHILHKDKSLSMVQDNRYDEYDAHLAQVRNNLYAQKKDKNCDEYVQARLAVKSQMNQPEGFWLGALEGDWADHLVHITLSREEIQSFLLCSDGFSRLFILEPNIGAQDILDGSITINECLERLREKENSTPDMHLRWSKKSDDASAILAEGI